MEARILLNAYTRDAPACAKDMVQQTRNQSAGVGGSGPSDSSGRCDGERRWQDSSPAREPGEDRRGQPKPQVQCRACAPDGGHLV